MPLNINDLENRIQQKIDGLTTANSSIEFVIPGMTEVSNVKSSVANTASLPNIYTDGIPNGTVVFVESLGVPVIASKCAWLGLDGRLLQKDVELSIWSSGNGGYGNLGDCTTANRSSPVSVVGGFTDWCQVSVGKQHTIGLRTNGTLWAWGTRSFAYPDANPMGTDQTTSASSPVSVVGGFTDWCQVSTSDLNSAAVRTNGTLWTWGVNSSGALGDGTTTNRRSPVPVVGGFTDWCQVTSGFINTIALRTNGTLWAWGSNESGPLGNGTTVNKSSPVSVLGGFTDWCQVSGGFRHTAAVRQNGTLWTWGCNTQGTLGDGTFVDKCSPVSVVGGFTDWCQVSAGWCHTAAVRTNGTLWAWGNGSFGRLGDGTSNSASSSPISVIGGFTDWCQVSAGSFHTAAVRQNGTLWVWGCNGSGRLGDGTIVAKCSPVSVVGGFTDWCQVAVGEVQTSAVRACIL